MNIKTDNSDVLKISEELSSPLNYKIHETAIILAAGHGKRIKSHLSKMLHKIWEVPTVERVYDACRAGIPGINFVVVVGIKAKDVMQVIGKRESTAFAYQEVQNGTGHAVQVALQKIDPSLFNGIVYVLPGDMGLLDSESMTAFRKEFIDSKADMMVLTGVYNGAAEENHYGRIVRVKETDDEGNTSGEDYEKVILIMEYKDIQSLSDSKKFTVKYNNRSYSFTKQELMEIKEFNSGVYAFDYTKLMSQINNLSSDNAQNEIYITDLIHLFNNAGYSVRSTSPSNQNVVMGFNNKSVRKEMDSIARKQVYERLKDIIEINDADDFFIAESVVHDIVEMDKAHVPLDILIDKGVYVGSGVKINYSCRFYKNAHVEGNINFGKNVSVGSNVLLSTFPGQKMNIGDNVEILSGDIIKGEMEIGDDTRIESSVNITGSDQFPVRIGKNVLIKGRSYIFGSVIEDEVQITQSVLIKKKVKRETGQDGKVKAIRFYIPPPEGAELVDDL